MIKNETSSSAYKMVSFDVSSLFTMVSSDCTINLILKKFMTIKKLKLRLVGRIFLVCTEKVHFTFEKNIYQQKDDVAMGSPLGPVLAGIFMVHFERTLMPQLEKFIKPGKRYRDDIIIYIKPDFLTKVI